MTPTSFAFTVTIPNDPRLVGVARALAVQAATYAQRSAASAEALAAEVERAAQGAVASTTGPIEFEFRGEGDAVAVVIICEAAASAPAPQSGSANGVSVDWHIDGPRRVCQIRQSNAA